MKVGETIIVGDEIKVITSVDSSYVGAKDLRTGRISFLLHTEYKPISPSEIVHYRRKRTEKQKELAQELDNNVI